MKSVLFFLVVFVGLAELAAYLLKKTYRKELLDKLSKEKLGVPVEDVIGYHDIKMDILKAKLLPIRFKHLPEKCRWQIFPTCLMAIGCITTIVFFCVVIRGCNLPPAFPLAFILFSWLIYRALALQVDCVMDNNFVPNEFRIKKLAKTMRWGRLVSLVMSLATGLIVTYFFFG